MPEIVTSTGGTGNLFVGENSLRSCRHLPSVDLVPSTTPPSIYPAQEGTPPMVTPVRAAVLRGVDEPFTFEDLTLDDIRPDEVLVKITAGRPVPHRPCRAARRHPQAGLPLVVGHEGAGVIEQVGSGVTGFAAGDAVALSFAACGSCRNCLAGREAYCVNFLMLNVAGIREDGTKTLTWPTAARSPAVSWPVVLRHPRDRGGEERGETARGHAAGDRRSARLRDPDRRRHRDAVAGRGCRWHDRHHRTGAVGLPRSWRRRRRCDDDHRRRHPRFAPGIRGQAGRHPHDQFRRRGSGRPDQGDLRRRRRLRPRHHRHPAGRHVLCSGRRPSAPRSRSSARRGRVR